MFNLVHRYPSGSVSSRLPIGCGGQEAVTDDGEKESTRTQAMEAVASLVHSDSESAVADQQADSFFPTIGAQSYHKIKRAPPGIGEACPRSAGSARVSS